MTQQAQTKGGWRYTLGFWMFTIPFVMIIGAPILVPFFVESGTEAAAIIGGIVILGEVVWFASIPLLGKAGFKELKSKAFGMFALPDGPISAGRHRWGIYILGFAFLLQELVFVGLLFGYFWLGDGNLTQGLFGFDLVQEARLFIGIIMLSAAMVVLSIYMLGTPFVSRLAKAFSVEPEPDAN